MQAWCEQVGPPQDMVPKKVPEKVPDLVHAWEAAAAAQFAADGDRNGWEEPAAPLTAEQRYVKVRWSPLVLGSWDSVHMSGAGHAWRLRALLRSLHGC